jgi:biopolymer transport protein ExbD
MQLFELKSWNFITLLVLLVKGCFTQLSEKETGMLGVNAIRVPVQNASPAVQLMVELDHDVTSLHYNRSAGPYEWRVSNRDSALLGKAVRSIAAEFKGSIVNAVINADPELPYKIVYRTMNVLKDNGIGKISIVVSAK